MKTLDLGNALHNDIAAPSDLKFERRSFSNIVNVRYQWHRSVVVDSQRADRDASTPTV